MSDDNDTPPVDQGSDDGAEMEMTLDEYCMRRSNGDRNVELIGGFHYNEKIVLGTVKDVQSAFDARFDTFANQIA